MKQIAIIGAAVGAVALFLYAKSKSVGAKQGTGPASPSASMQLGILDPNYSSIALIWNADQKNRMAGPNANPNPIVGWFTKNSPAHISGVSDCPCCTPTNVVGPIPDTCSGTVNGPSGTTALTCGSPSGASSGCDGILPASGSPSPTFWAADKVPINQALPNSDADPSLAIGWFNV